MSFLNPWLLGGIAAIAAPILLHMIARRRVRPVAWAAMRFVQAIVQRNQRRLRIEDLLLLILRCLLLILLALALARPAFRAAGLPGPIPGTAVIAVDNSGSMGLTDGAASRFDNARRAARQIVDRLPQGSSVALLAFSDIAQPVIAEPSADLEFVRKSIADLKRSDRASDALPAIRQAIDILQRHPAEGREFYIVTDAGVNGWKQSGAIADALKIANVRPRLVLTGPAPQPNLGISELQPAGELVPVNRSVRFVAEVTNYGPAQAVNLPVSLAIGREPASGQEVIPLIPPGEGRRVSLFGRFTAAGRQAVTVSLPPDHLAMDDRRSVVVRARNELRVLLVEGEHAVIARESDVFFLNHAFAPSGPGDFVKTRTVPAAELSGENLSDYAAIALANAGELPAAAVSALDDYVRGGGGLMLFPGARTGAAAFGGKLSPLLPATPGEPRGNAGDRSRFFTFQPSGYTHPVVSIWSDPAAGTLATARFYKSMTLRPRPGARVILAFADGSPAIVERDLGAGRVILFASTANTDWNDLPVHPAFVPLMQRTLARLVSRGDEAYNIAVGEPLICAAKPELLGQEATIRPPGAGPEAAARMRVTLSNGTPVLRFDETDRAGIYEVTFPGQPPLPFAAQPDPEESKQATIPDAELAKLGDVSHWNGRSEIAGSAGGAREFGSVFAMLAVAVACAECVLAGRFSAPK